MTRHACIDVLRIDSFLAATLAFLWKNLVYGFHQFLLNFGQMKISSNRLLICLDLTCERRNVKNLNMYFFRSFELHESSLGIDQRKSFGRISISIFAQDFWKSLNKLEF